MRAVLVARADASLLWSQHFSRQQLNTKSGYFYSAVASMEMYVQNGVKFIRACLVIWTESLELLRWN